MQVYRVVTITYIMGRHNNPVSFTFVLSETKEHKDFFNFLSETYNQFIDVKEAEDYASFIIRQGNINIYVDNPSSLILTYFDTYERQDVEGYLHFTNK